jgi:hypothetical protein
MAINLTCECGKRLRIPNELMGKQARCSVCKAVVSVPVVEARLAAPPPRPRRRPAEEEEAEPRPAPKKKGGAVKFVLLGCLGVMLLGCTGVVGVVAWFIVSTSGIDERLVGAWKVDPVLTTVVSSKLNKPFPEKMRDLRLNFHKDGTCMVLAAGNKRTGKWNKLRSFEKGTRIQIKYDGGGHEVWEFSILEKGPLPGDRLAVEKGLANCVLVRDTTTTPAGGPTQQNTKDRATTEPPAFTLAAEELGKAYRTNKVAAEAKYKDKRLAVEGAVTDLDLDPQGIVVLRLEGYQASKNDPPNQVRCLLSATQTDRALRLGRGQKVKVQGKCNDYIASLFINLAEAELVQEIGPDPAIRLSLTQLAREHAQGPMALDKYKDKPVVVRGQVVELKKGQFADVILISQGKKGRGPALQVSAAFSPDWKKRFAGFKPGDRIQIKGEFSRIADGLVHINRCWPVP